MDKTSEKANKFAIKTVTCTVLPQLYRYPILSHMPYDRIFLSDYIFRNFQFKKNLYLLTHVTISVYIYHMYGMYVHMCVHVRARVCNIVYTCVHTY